MAKKPGILGTVAFLVVTVCLPARGAPVLEVAGQSVRGYASTLVVDGDLAYVTMGSALSIFNVSDPSNPVEVGRTYVTNCFDGDSALATVGGRKYLFVDNDIDGVWIFDVQDPAHPFGRRRSPSPIPLHRAS